MKGSPLPLKITNMLRDDAIQNPGTSLLRMDSPLLQPGRLPPNINNQIAKKTGYQTNYKFNDYKYKEDSLMELEFGTMKIDPKDLRKRTKGSFNEVTARIASPNQNFSKDLKWINKANPEA